VLRNGLSHVLSDGSVIVLTPFYRPVSASNTENTQDVWQFVCSFLLHPSVYLRRLCLWFICKWVLWVMYHHMEILIFWNQFISLKQNQYNPKDARCLYSCCFLLHILRVTRNTVCQSRWPRGVRLRDCWDRAFESRWGHGYSSIGFVCVV
jgi:hypothetical protein